jgi:hypothetical protein
LKVDTHSIAFSLLLYSLAFLGTYLGLFLNCPKNIFTTCSPYIDTLVWLPCDTVMLNFPLYSPRRDYKTLLGSTIN